MLLYMSKFVGERVIETSVGNKTRATVRTDSQRVQWTEPAALGSVFPSLVKRLALRMTGEVHTVTVRVKGIFKGIYRFQFELWLVSSVETRASMTRINREMSSPK